MTIRRQEYLFCQGKFQPFFLILFLSFILSLSLVLRRSEQGGHFPQRQPGCSFFWASHAIKMKEQGPASKRGTATAEIMLQISDENHYRA